MSPALPPDWRETTDPNSHQVYYYNTVTGETSWSLPSPQQPHNEKQQQHHDEQPPHSHEPTSVNHNSTAQPPSAIPRSLPKDRRSAVPNAQLLSQSLKEHQQHQQAQPEEKDAQDLQNLELQSLSAGQIADLCHLQQQQQSHEMPPRDDSCYQAALNPTLFLPQQERAPTEPGRLDTRVAALREKLNRIQQ